MLLWREVRRCVFGMLFHVRVNGEGSELLSNLPCHLIGFTKTILSQAFIEALIYVAEQCSYTSRAWAITTIRVRKPRSRAKKGARGASLSAHRSTGTPGGCRGGGGAAGGARGT